MARRGAGGFFVVWNRIPELMVAVESNSRAAVKAKADAVLRNAKGRIHRVTGHLQDSAYTEVIEAGHAADIAFPAEYAGYVEYGTYKMSARPFLRPAIEAEKDDFFNRMGRVVTFGKVG